MKWIASLSVVFLSSLVLMGQTQLEFVGLDNTQLTSLDINYGIIAVGTDKNGVFWQQDFDVSESAWTAIALDEEVRAVYPHKSGPIGWAISAGIHPATETPPYLYCSQMGGDFFANSSGIDSILTTQIADLDGFPDETICGETYAVADRELYRRNFGDTIWHPVFQATIEGYLQTVKVHIEYPGVVLLGGADGFAGRLLARSTDFGDTWEDISAPGAVAGIDFAGNEADTIFAVGYDLITMTTDGADNWVVVFQEGLQMHFTEVLYDANRNTIYAAGGDIGGHAVLLKSLDFGNTWDAIALDTLDTILGLEAGSDGWIYFITRDEGVFRLREKTSAVQDVNRDAGIISFMQNDPNPVSHESRLSYALSAPGDVRVSVLSATSTEVAELVHRAEPAGAHHLVWDASDLSAGVYFLQLAAGTDRLIRKIIVTDR